MNGLPVRAIEPYMNKDEIADILGVSPATVDRMRAEGLPWVRVGRKSVRFKPSTVIAWVNGQRQDAA